MNFKGRLIELGGVYRMKAAVQSLVEPAPGNLEGTKGVFLKGVNIEYQPVRRRRYLRKPERVP